MKAYGSLVDNIGQICSARRVVQHCSGYKKKQKNMQATYIIQLGGPGSAKFTQFNGHGCSVCTGLQAFVFSNM